jgi:hypothetical protein
MKASEGLAGFLFRRFIDSAATPRGQWHCMDDKESSIRVEQEDNTYKASACPTTFDHYLTIPNVSAGMIFQND